MTQPMKRVAIALLCLLASATMARAEAPPACTGTDLAAKLKAEDPATYDAVMAEAKAIPNGQAIFWKIEHDGLPPSHLLGTAHVTDPRVTDLEPRSRMLWLARRHWLSSWPKLATRSARP